MPEVPTQAAFDQLLAVVEELQNRVTLLEVRLPEWVPEDQAQEITGLSRSTLARERKNPNTVLIWKKAGGLRYQQASLLAFNEARTANRNRYLRKYLTAGPVQQ